MQLHIDVNPQQAEALSQVLKRIGFSDIRALSYDEDEAYNAQYAAEQVRQALAVAGYNPR